MLRMRKVIPFLTEPQRIVIPGCSDFFRTLAQDIPVRGENAFLTENGFCFQARNGGQQLLPQLRGQGEGDALVPDQPLPDLEKLSRMRLIDRISGHMRGLGIFIILFSGLTAAAWFILNEYLYDYIVITGIAIAGIALVSCIIFVISCRKLAKQAEQEYN